MSKPLTWIELLHHLNNVDAQDLNTTILLREEGKPNKTVVSFSTFTNGVPLVEIQDRE